MTLSAALPTAGIWRAALMMSRKILTILIGDVENDGLLEAREIMNMKLKPILPCCQHATLPTVGLVLARV